ncbi:MULTISPECIES: thioredoxin domain-containing protein [Staphylococcus]|uniref:thioredoxin domain-containing protein n=1 Tax=Staphylococcus TaxID=1279 RepID=UPI0008A47F01|nr:MULTISPECIES: thioredoxin domain-containing protein [Staphylococcus]ARB77033.1 protein-disulfide isomerase [Staphylococcus lugdunensis]ARJ18083.1 protein-disulfide isomerase [Staphylococcus lugdunensis]MBM7134632.1 thioredoxin domain-containing protein [Staphylococcus lugdunensis]MCH8642934.1 DsbA family protein [Staphylococcus lugdunensis]MCH8645713.1 DsbA family protein [Staphylococcus lugdunensis]
MKKRLSIILLLTFLVILSACAQQKKDAPSAPQATKHNKPLIVEYGDYKCPYCKKVETQVMPTIKKKYIDTGKADYQFINMAFLGKDSIIGARAGHAVNAIAPQAYLDFQQKIYAAQEKNDDKEWITPKLIDKQIDQLNISQQQKHKIKADYKQENSQSWKAADKDKQLYKKHHISKAPTVFINGKKVKDPYDIKSWEQQLDK